MNYPTTFLHAPSRQRAGFSLIEVTLSIGIVAFAFIGLFGLLPTGMNVFRSAIDTSIGSQITEEVTQNAQQSDFDTLIGGPYASGQAGSKTTVTFYDEQGNLLLDQSNTPITRADYRTIYDVLSKASVPTDLPASAGASLQNTTYNVATITVLIAKDPAHALDLKNIDLTKDTSKVGNRYVAFVARNLSAFEAPIQ